jgi:hypothetical protein
VQDLTTQGSMVIHSPAQSHEHLNLFMHGRSHSHSATNSPAQPAQNSTTAASTLSKLPETAPSNPPFPSAAQARPTQLGGKATVPLPPGGVHGGAISEPAHILPAAPPDVILAAAGHSEGVTHGMSAIGKGGAISTGGSGPETSAPGTDHAAAGQGTCADPTAAPVGVATRVPPVTAPPSGNSAVSQSSPAGDSAGRDGAKSFDPVGSPHATPNVLDSALDRCNGALPGTVALADLKSHLRKPHHDSSPLGGGANAAQGGGVHLPTRPSQNATAPACPSNDIDSYALKHATAAEAESCTPVAGICTPAGGSSALHSTSGPSLKGPASSHTGEHYTTHDSEVLRGIVMLGEGGEPVLLDDSEHHAADPHDTVEDAVLRRWEKQTSMKRGNNELIGSSPLPLAPVESGAHSALFRTMTPGEALRRQQPGWRQSQEWHLLNEGFHSRVESSDHDV